VSRLSGDEFAIVLSDLGSPADAEFVAGKLIQSLREPHVLEQHEVNVSCSIGLAVFPEDATGCDDLLRAADDAVYHAKQFRNTWRRYSADMRRTGPDARLAFSAVRRVLEDRRLEVFYQPQVQAGTRVVSGVEALVRWRDAEGGLLPTAELIRLAEDAGLISEITDHVLGTAMNQVLAWRALPGVGPLQLAVNVSGVEVRGGALLPMLRRHLERTGFPPAALELEITESTVMHSAPSTMSVFEELKRLGVRLSVDDFGTGYSSLSRLQRLPVDSLKMDQSFIQDIDRSGALARGIVMMAHALNLAVVAEGVETMHQLQFLEDGGCDFLQGYLFSSPLPASEMPQYLLTGARATPGASPEDA
jgi:EAL domain-containing protein (putative c-di-GMP-specific phosphodiesterase class I)